MSAILDGTFEGTAKEGKWSSWEDENRGGKKVPIFQIPVEIQQGTDTCTVFPSLFFDTDLVDRGVDAGKSKVQQSLEILQSYGVDCNPKNPSESDPSTFASQLDGKTVKVFCKENDKGEQVAYLNRMGKPPLEDSELKDIWSSLGDDEPEAVTAGAPIDDDDDLPFS